jgi:hypothetical protein
MFHFRLFFRLRVFFLLVSFLDRFLLRFFWISYFMNALSRFLVNLL